MKKLILCAVAVMALYCVRAADANWLTDLPAAQAQAKVENKIVLMDFTGSDWCEGCIALHKKVFDNDTFQSYAATNVVLVQVDFPEKKPQSKELKAANAALSTKYDVEGYPTVIILNADGKEIGRQVGYDGIDAKTFIKILANYKAGK